MRRASVLMLLLAASSPGAELQIQYSAIGKVLAQQVFTQDGRKYVRGYHPEARTPVYVSRGIGTTGPPSRFMCPPEVAILTLISA